MPSLIGQFSKLSNLFAHSGNSGAGGMAVGAYSGFERGCSQLASMLLGTLGGTLGGVFGTCGTPQPGSGLSIGVALGASIGVGAVLTGSLALYCARVGAALVTSGVAHSMGGNSSGDECSAIGVAVGISGINEWLSTGASTCEETTLGRAGGGTEMGAA